MELTQAKERLNLSQVRSTAAELVVKLSYLSLGIFIVLIPLRYRWILQTHLIKPIYPDYTNLLLFPTDLFLALTVLLWLVGLALKPRQVSTAPKLLTYPLALVVVFSGISILFSVDRLVSLYNAIQVLLFFCLYLYLVNEIHSLTLLIAPVGLQISIQGVVAVAQVLRQHSLGLASLQELALDPATKGISIVWSSGVRSLRAYGLSDHPNLLGGCLALALILLAAGYLETRPTWRPWLAGLFSLGVLALLLTFSRAAWLGLFAGLGFVLVWIVATREKDLLLRWLGLGGGALLLLLPFLWSNAPFLGSRFNLDGSFSLATPENQSINERALLNSQAFTILSQHPLTGIGIGAFPEALQRLVPHSLFDYQPPANVLLEIAAETGLPGALAYLLVLLAPWILLFHSRKKYRFSLPLVAASAGLLAITVVSFLDYYPWLVNAGRTWQWLLWGLWGGIYLGITRRQVNG